MDKKYKVLFFTTSVGQDGLPLRSALPTPLLQGTTTPENLQPHEIDGHEFQIRDLQKIGSSHVWRGVFGRLRDDAPNLVNALGQESVIPLQPTDRLLEKCHFLYMANQDVLVWQVNNDVANVSKFATYIGLLLNLPIFVTTIVSANALQRVIAGTIKTIECKVATPRTPLTTIPTYSQPMFDLMNSVHGSTIKINVSAGRGTLAGNVKHLIRWALGNPDTKTLRAKIDGDEEPIDLLTERVSESILIPLDGHYPNATAVFAGLNRAFADQKTELRPYFR